MKELFLDLQEANDLPGVTQLLELAREKGVITSHDLEGSLGSHPQAVVSGQMYPEASGRGEIPSKYGTNYTSNLFNQSSELIKGLGLLRGDQEPPETPEEWAGEAAARSTEDPDLERRPSPTIDTGVPTTGEHASAQYGAGSDSNGERPSPEPAEEITEEGLKSDLADLRRSLQDVRSSIPTNLAPRPSEAAPPALPDEIALPEPPAAVPEPADLVGEVDTDDLSAVEPVPQELDGELPLQNEDLSAVQSMPQDSEDKLPPELAETYTGSLTLVFTPSPDGEMLGLIWDLLDREAGIGTVIDATPLKGEEGYEFTLDLGDDALVIDNLVSGIPRAELTAIDEDKLNINWAPV